MTEAQKYTNENICKILVANKIDVQGRQVSQEEGKQLAQKNELKYFETSAKDDTGVQDLFKFIAEELQNIEVDLRSNYLIEQIEEQPMKKKSKCC